MFAQQQTQPVQQIDRLLAQFTCTTARAACPPPPLAVSEFAARAHTQHTIATQLHPFLAVCAAADAAAALI